MVPVKETQMQTLYRVLAFVVVGLVAVQAASHAWGSAGLVKYLSEGGTLDMDAMTPFTEVAGYVIHAMNGMYVIPAVADPAHRRVHQQELRGHHLGCRGGSAGGPAGRFRVAWS